MQCVVLAETRKVGLFKILEANFEVMVVIAICHMITQLMSGEA